MKGLVFFAAAVGVALACNGGPADDPDCMHGDLGSCGVACCKLSFVFERDTTPLDVMLALTKAMMYGGPDGRYALQTTAHGKFGFTDEFNYPPYRPTVPYHYVGQAYHTTPFPGGNVTSGPYRDTVNWMIYDDDGITTLRAFSISEINGALGDHGMNFKNILQVMRTINIGDIDPSWTMSQEDDSCPLAKQ